MLTNFGDRRRDGAGLGAADTLADVKQAISERRGVVAMVDTHAYWGDEGGGHAVVVTGVELDKDGNVTAVFINDTGLGECGLKVPAAKFGQAMKDLAGSRLVVTKGAVW